VISPSFGLFESNEPSLTKDVEARTFDSRTFVTSSIGARRALAFALVAAFALALLCAAVAESATIPVAATLMDSENIHSIRRDLLLREVAVDGERIRRSVCKSMTTQTMGKAPGYRFSQNWLRNRSTVVAAIGQKFFDQLADAGDRVGYGAVCAEALG
jgi:hypothetical protein